MSSKEVKCKRCKEPFMARLADLKRGRDIEDTFHPFDPHSLGQE